MSEVKVKLRYTINNTDYTTELRLNCQENLENSFNKYRNTIHLENAQKDTAFYLERGNAMLLLDKRVKIKNLNLRDGDLIHISFQENNKEISKIHTTHNVSSAYLNDQSDIVINDSSTLPKKKKRNFILIFALIAFIIIVVGIIIAIYLLKKKNKKVTIQEQDDKNDKVNDDDNDNNKDDNDGNDDGKQTQKDKVYTIEKLISEKRPYYPINMLFLYQSDKIMKVSIDSGQENENNVENGSTVKEYMNFGLLIRDENQEKVEEQSIIKKWFTGYISLLNLTINNGTHDMDLNYNEELHKFIQSVYNTNKRNLRKLDESTEGLILNDDKELCFVKINFYENGEIKDIFYPEEFNLDNMVYIDKIAKLIIPKLSKNLFIENIDDKIDKINKYMEGIYDVEEEEDSANLENEPEQENLDENPESENHLLKNKNNRILFRKISENDSYYINNTNNLDNLSNTENIINQDVNNSFVESELTTEISNSSNDDALKIILKGIEENETFSNITDFEMETIESAQAKLDGSALKRIKNSLIDEKGMLVFITESENMTIAQPAQENLNGATKEEDQLKSQIDNENNNISRNKGDEFFGKDMTFNISNIKSENFNNISLYTNILNEEFATNIFKYFDKFTYIRYKQENEKELKLRVLRQFKDDFLKENKDIDPSQIEVEHSKLQNKKKNRRNLENSDSYYGMKNMENEKILFKYNLIGLDLAGIIVSKIDISTGICTSYLKLIIGSLILNFQLKAMQTNMHIIAKNTNQMTYNFISLLYNTNEDLTKRNQIYSDFIIDLEKNVTKLYEKYYDYSGLFRDSLDDLYDQIKNFSGQMFNELIITIDRVYNNYTIVLNNAENNTYEIMTEIRELTKIEYINYINEMFNIIISFKNYSLLFLTNLKKEVETIQTFQIDILYDLMDLLYETKLVLKDFIAKLFQAVDTGVTTFKYKLRDYMEEIIGQLLYLTDFLSVNLNKNEILKNAINLEERERVTIKLKNFRNIVLRIIEILDNQIIDDYEREMSTSNENSIKYSKVDIIQNCIEDMDNKSTIITEEIKAKIQSMNYYESYAENIQIINEITNKTFIEFNTDIYNQVLRNIQKIKPEFLDKNSDLKIYKNDLLNISDKVINYINKEINQINNYINSYSSNFIDDNNYNFDYNIYNFRYYFTDTFLSTKLDEFILIIKKAFRIQYTQMINNHYDLAYKYIEDVSQYLYREKYYRILGKVFHESFIDYQRKLANMGYTNIVDEFSKFISDNFYNVSNYVINYINKKLQSINKHYFNPTETYKNNWFKLDLIKKEIERIINNINNHFNENTWNMKISQTIINISTTEIPALMKEKNEKLSLLFDETYKLAQDYDFNISDCEIIGIKEKSERLWYTLWILEKKDYEKYCKFDVTSRGNIDKIVKNLSPTKDYLSARFNSLINSYINAFDYYLNNYISCIQKLYNNLYKYTEEKIQNNENIQLILEEYKNILNNILINNTEEKIIEKIYSNDETNLTNIFNKLENNIFEMNNKFYHNYYLEKKKFFLEYPEEILLKLNQSANNLKLNNQIIKNKIN